MSSCSGLDSVAIERAKRYYDELLSSVSVTYNSFHNFIYQILCVLGVLANICIIVVLLRPSMRKNPFNLFLIAIAICDMTLMASYFIYKQIEICHPWYFSYAWIVFTYVYAILSVFVHSTSLWITVNMAVLRYLVLRYSALSSGPKLNSYHSTSVAIVVALTISLVGSAPNTLRYRIHDGGMLRVPGICVNGSKFAEYYKTGQLVHAYTLDQPKFWNCSWERVSFWTAGLLLKLVPCLLLTVFMMLLIMLLMEAHERRFRLTARCATPILNNTQQRHSESRRQSTVSGAKSQAERTTAMLTIIVAIFLLTEMPQGILVLAIGIQPQVRFAMHQLGNIIDLLSLLNSSVNFILYSTMSNLFRSEFLQTFGNCCYCLRRTAFPSAHQSYKSNAGAAKTDYNGIVAESSTAAMQKVEKARSSQGDELASRREQQPEFVYRSRNRVPTEMLIESKDDDDEEEFIENAGEEEGLIPLVENGIASSQMHQCYDSEADSQI